MDIYEDLADRFVRPIIEHHREVGRAQGRAEARAEAKDQARAEAARAQNELWHAWLRRKEQAEAQGLAFNEPHPGSDQNSNS